MIYIYDLVLNWCDYKRYEFFEWEDNDEIEYIKRIPIFKINNFDDVLDNCIKLKKDFLIQIYNKSEVYGNKKIEKVEYSCIFCDKELNRAIAIEFNDQGESIYRSNIYFSDLDDVFVLVEKAEAFDLNYKIMYKYKEKDLYLTRNEKEKKKYLVNEINYAYKEKNFDKLKYIYFEMFGEEIENTDIIRNKLLESLDNNYSYMHDNIYNLIKIPNFL